MDTDRTLTSETPHAAPPICGTQADSRSGRLDGDLVCAPQWDSVAHAAARDGMRVGHHLLASVSSLATPRRLEAVAYRPPRRAPAARAARSGPGRRRQCLPPRAAGGKKTGPNPTDRRKAGSKHHVLTDAHGIPIVATLTAANRHDITQLLPMVDAIPPLRGCVGRPLRKPRLIQGDRGYDSQPHRNQLHHRGIHTALARRWTEHGSGLGRTRWVVERTLAWLHRFRRLAVRYERRPCIHEAFLTLGCVLICWNHLRPVP